MVVRYANAYDTHARGERHPNHKVTAAQVKEIRRRWDAGEKSLAIAKSYGISETTVQNIGHRRTWKHI